MVRRIGRRIGRIIGGIIGGRGGGGAPAPDTSAADRMYQLQREQLELQKKQLAELERKEKGAAAAKQEKLEELLRRKRTGRRATILTSPEGLPPIL